MNRPRREHHPSIYRNSPYMDLPPTTVLPKKRGGKSKNKGKKANVSPFNLGNAFNDEDVEGDDVMITGEQDTGIYFTYENEDTNKVLLHHYGRFTSPPGRKFIDGMFAIIDPVELDNFLTNQVKFILTNSLGYDENSSTFIYLKKPNCSLDLGLVPLADAIQDRDILLTTMDTTIDQQVAMDEALIPHAQRLRIGMSNFCLLSDIKSKESTLQLVYDVLCICPFFKAFLGHATYLSKGPGQSFAEPPFEEEILAFIRFLRHSAAIMNLTDVNINKLYQPWRSFAAIINKCLTAKSSGCDSLRISQAQILDDHMFSTIKLVSRHQNTQQFSALLPIELTNKEIRNSNAYKEYYAIATGAAPPKPKASTHISQASGSGADEGTGFIPRVSDVPTDESEEELSWNSTDEEGDDKGKDGDGDEEDNGDDGEEGNGDDDDDENDDGKEGDDDEDDQEVERDDDMDDEEEGEDNKQEYDEKEYAKETRDEESFDPIPKTPENSDDEGNGEEDIGLNIGGEEGHVEEEEEDELYRDRLNEAVKVAVQIQSNCLRDEAQKENDEFLKTVDENMQKIIKEQVKEQVKTSYAVDLSEMGLKKIFIKKMEGNKRHDDDADKDEEPSAGPDRGSKRRKEGKEHESASASTETATKSTGRELAKQIDSRSSFNELMDTPLDFSNFLINRLKVDTLTLELLAGPTYELMKGSYKSLVKLEYHLKEVFKATTDQLDWVNPEGQQYPHNLLKPLPLIPNNRGRRVIPFENFINNDLEYLRGGASSHKSTTSITKTKAAYYGHIKWIEDLVLRTMWVEEPIGYNKHALWGVSYWGRTRQQFYGFIVNRESTRDVYSKRRTITVTELKIVDWHSYKHLDWITM
nr:hypothetical protein [Tanacetum cinerariifolium]